MQLRKSKASSCWFRRQAATSSHRSGLTLKKGSLVFSLESGDAVSTHFVPGTPYGDLVASGGALLLFTGWMKPFGELVALDPDTGDVRWSVAPPDTSTWTAKRPFGRGDRAFIGNDRGDVFAVDVASGQATPLWHLGSTVRSFAFADGMTLVGTLDGALRAFRDE